VAFEQLEELLDQSITITRNLRIDLSPAVLQGEGLADALVWLAAQMHDQYGLQVSIHPNDISTRFEDTLRILLFQAVREALFNVVKHAETSRADISFSKLGDEILIIVSDHGRGFDVTGTFNESQGSGGLMNIRHRLQLMGCDLRIESERGRGTHMTIHVSPTKVQP
jgi:signal transduction histidine kinase